MTSQFRLPTSDFKAILLDIEGTTTPIAFVYDVLFPFVRRRLRAYLFDPGNHAELVEPLRRLRQEWSVDPDYHSRNGGPGGVQARTGPDPDGPGGDLEGMAAYVIWLMDQDRKSPGLKLLQGQIWDEGYRRGELKGEVFADVAPALRRWRDAGVVVAIYSSGSELAQRRLFATTAHGDLTPLLAHFFDTAVGAKQAAESYRRIARELGMSPDRMLFVSDVTTELDAAHSAGCQVRLCVRPGNRPQPNHEYPVIESFDNVLASDR